MSLSKVGRRSLRLLGDGVREERERDHNRFPATEMGMRPGGEQGVGRRRGGSEKGGEKRERGAKGLQSASLRMPAGFGGWDTAVSWGKEVRRG